MKIAPGTIKIGSEVAAALAAGQPIVALESTIISHGLPRPRNLAVALEVEEQVRRFGAVPATIAVVNGQPTVGLDESDLQIIANDENVVKVSVRDLGMAMTRGMHGACTVAATSYLASATGIRVFATGGLGGVHRDAKDTWDESADLPALATLPVAVVCAGVKSILDVGATLERLETLAVPVVGYRTNQFPGFYLTESGFEIEWRCDSASEIAAVSNARRDLDLQAGIVVANPLSTADQLDLDLHAKLLTEGLAAANAKGVHGKAVTPFLLDYFHRESNGQSLEVNIKVVLNNAALAAQIAAAL